MQKVLSVATLVALFVFLLLSSLNPVKAQQDPPRADCCYQIYSVGSNLGWASALLDHTTSRNGLVPADDAIFGALDRAGAHVESAYKTCSGINPAWPGWSSYQAFLRNMVNAIKQRPDPVVRKQVAQSIRGTFTWAEALRHQVWGGQQLIHDTCAEKYFKLGSLLGYAQQTLAIAEEWRQSGRDDWLQAVNDALMPLQGALQVLDQYFELSGCTELRGLNLLVRIQNVRQENPRERLEAMHQEITAILQAVQQAVTNGCDLGAGPAQILTGDFVGVWRQVDPQVPQPPTVRVVHDPPNGVRYLGFIVDPGAMANEGFGSGEQVWFFQGIRLRNANGDFCPGGRERRRPNAAPYNERATFTFEGQNRLIIRGYDATYLPPTTWVRISM